MADTSSAARSDELDSLRDDIELNTGLLASLDDGTDSESEQTRQVVKRTLKKLRKRLQSLVSTPADMEDEHQSGGPSGDASVIKKESGSAGRPGFKDKMPPPTFDLVSRKRQRGDFDDDLRESKSQRQSPSPSITVGGSPAPSADSTDSFDFDDPLLGGLLGGYSREEENEHKRYMKSLDERKQQEEEDAAFARELQSQFNSEPAVPASSQNHSQSVLQPNGLFNRPSKIESPQKPKPLVKPESSYRSFGSGSGTIGASAPSTPSDTSIEEIAARDFPSQHQHTDSRAHATMSSMPGAFPGAPQLTSMGGSSVYNSTPYNGATSNLRYPPNPYASTGVAGSRNIPGSMMDPVDLDRYQPYNQYVDPAETEEELKNLLKHIRPDEDLTPEQRDHVPVGLKMKLMPHQALGVAWLKAAEDGTNKGGILADDMGLGKTVQAISLMLSRPPPQNERRPNLIVAPVALLQQWRREIEKFVLPSHKLSVVILHRQPQAATYNSIKHFDCVITTYGKLSSELKKAILFEDRQSRDPEARPTKAEECVILGPRSRFHRIFLDEAQNIKNRNTKAAIAACKVDATYRWCLSGTPMQNNVEEMYSLIRFCRIRPYNDWTRFSRDFSRPLKSRYEPSKDKAMQQLQALLRAILLRRTKTSEIDGKPILQLPAKSTVEDRAVFSQDEMDFYKALESKAQIQFNKYVRAGTIGRNYSNALVLLLRLRQACCHPFLVSKSGDFMLDKIGSLEPTDLIANARELSGEVVERLKTMEGFECPVCMDASENPVIFQCGHGLCEDCLAKLCDQALSSEEGSKANCPHCRAQIDANKTTNLISFLRVYCPDREGVEPLGEDEADVATESESSDDDSDDSDDDGSLGGFVVNDDDEVDYDTDSTKRKKNKSGSSSRASSRKPLKSALKGKGKANEKPTKNKSLAELRKEGLRSKAAKKKYLRRLAKDWVPSTKIEKAVKLLEEIRDRGENEKTIIFSNFTSFLDLLEVPLSRHRDLGVYARYDGSMTPAERNDAIISFTDNKHCRALLCSLKAGNVGLNLTAANHVIMMDPFWNPFVEYQAADRCYRIGQMKEVTVHRLIIGQNDETVKPQDHLEDAASFTVEDRILKLQSKKKALVETALDERAGQALGRLGVRELGYLFGVNSLRG